MIGSGAAVLGIGVDFASFDNDTTARVGTGAVVNAARDIGVHAATRMEGDSFIGMATIDTKIGLGLSASLYRIRGDLQDPVCILPIIGPCIIQKFFLDDLSGTPWEKDKIDPELYKRFVGLTKYGVEGYLCQITYKRLKIDQAKTRKDAFLKFVPSGVATVAELQAKGFGYIKVG